MPDSTRTSAPTEAELEGAIACILRSAADMKMLRNYGLDRVDPAAFDAAMRAVTALSVAAGAALASAGRCPPPPSPSAT